MSKVREPAHSQAGMQTKSSDCRAHISSSHILWARAMNSKKYKDVSFK